MSRGRATAIGLTAVLLWALLALLTVATAPVPPFQLNAICFAIGGFAGLLWSGATGGLGRLRAVPTAAYLLGIAGLFGYHALYFTALRLAPPAEASLIAYLWPLLIVLMSGFLPGERLRAGHLIGALIAFAGAAIIVLGAAEGFGGGAATGYVLAGLCALTWSGYSVLSRRFAAVPTDAVTVSCLATAVLSALLHLLFEETAWPQGPRGWAATLLLGLGPVGLAFYVWDIGVKRGDIQFLGVASYAAPLLSTLALVIAGITPPTPSLLAAAALIAGGAALAARASARAVRPSPTASESLPSDGVSASSGR
jgi:drug/metabolite transporter (DMT)-like permease